MTMDMYYNGRLSEAVAALTMPIMAAECQANAVYRCAKDAGPSELSRQTLVSEINRLEKALATLRQALDMTMPAPRLMAAE